MYVCVRDIMLLALHALFQTKTEFSHQNAKIAGRCGSIAYSSHDASTWFWPSTKLQHQDLQTCIDQHIQNALVQTFWIGPIVAFEPFAKWKTCATHQCKSRFWAVWTCLSSCSDFFFDCGCQVTTQYYPNEYGTIHQPTAMNYCPFKERDYCTWGSFRLNTSAAAALTIKWMSWSCERMLWKNALPHLQGFRNPSIKAWHVHHQRRRRNPNVSHG